MLTLVFSQLLPLLAGLAVHEWRPALASALLKPAARLSMLLNLSVVVLILATQYPLLLSIKPLGFAGMLALLAASLLVGWLLGGSSPAIRKSFSLTTSIRNAGVGIVIATGAFPGTLAAPALLAYALVSILGSLAVAVWWGRSAGAAREA
ncbi:MAG: hypothetical protein JO359_01080 [Candidatus Eremiobacteraeota bacterium]|nr:hypothetical protein [Candidatus Eremiobacteraeota bacterium]